jgi:hypothetical protein
MAKAHIAFEMVSEKKRNTWAATALRLLNTQENICKSLTKADMSWDSGCIFILNNTSVWNK